MRCTICREKLPHNTPRWWRQSHYQSLHADYARSIGRWYRNFFVLLGPFVLGFDEVIPNSDPDQTKYPAYISVTIVIRNIQRLIFLRDGRTRGFWNILIVKMSPVPRRAPSRPCARSCSTIFLNFSLVGSAATRIVGIP